MQSGKDPRKDRTRSALLQAFNELVLEDRKTEIRVGDVVDRAKIGRSTFYEHYRGADDLFLHAAARPLAVLADAVVGIRDAAELEGLVEHFRANRELAQDSFNGPMRDAIVRVLAQLIEDRLRDRKALAGLPGQLVIHQLAEAPIALVRSWLSSSAPCSAESLAQLICRWSGATVREFFPRAAGDC